MKKLFVGICLLVLSVGCTPEKPKGFDLDTSIGRIVEIDIEGRRYKVRVNTPNGTDDVWFRDTDVTVVVE